MSDLDAEYSYLNDPRTESLARYAAVNDIRCAMHQRRGEVLGISRIAEALSGVASRLQAGDLDAASDYLTGILRGAADVVASLAVETTDLARQIEHLAGVER